MGVVALLAVGCGGADTDRAATVKHEKTQARGPVVATVDGDPISLSEVQELVDATGLSPREALERLENERLLAMYAEQRGYGQDANARRELERARARALLANAVEKGTAPEDMPAAEVQARFETIKERDKRFDQRAVTHVLFRIEKGQDGAPARAAADRLLSQLRSRSNLADQVSMLEGFAPQGSQDGVQFVREDFDAAQDGKLDKSFADAAFETAGVGLVPKVVETSYGFHVIVVRELKPAEPFLLATYEADIRKQLASEKRKAALDALLEALKTKDPVLLDEALIKRAMADETLLGKAP